MEEVSQHNYNSNKDNEKDISNFNISKINKYKNQ